MLNTDIDVDNVKIIMEDITNRTECKWDNMNYTDKYNMIICARVMKKQIDSFYKILTAWADVPLEYIQNERIRQIEADKYSLTQLIH